MIHLKDGKTLEGIADGCTHGEGMIDFICEAVERRFHGQASMQAMVDYLCDYEPVLHLAYCNYHCPSPCPERKDYVIGGGK